VKNSNSSRYLDIREQIAGCLERNGSAITMSRFDLTARQLTEAATARTRNHHNVRLSPDTARALDRFVSAPDPDLIGDGNRWVEAGAQSWPWS
jgi:hypothetical protein